MNGTKHHIEVMFSLQARTLYQPRRLGVLASHSNYSPWHPAIFSHLASIYVPMIMADNAGTSSVVPASTSTVDNTTAIPPAGTPSSALGSNPSATTVSTPTTHETSAAAEATPAPAAQRDAPAAQSNAGQAVAATQSPVSQPTATPKPATSRKVSLPLDAPQNSEETEKKEKSSAIQRSASSASGLSGSHSLKRSGTGLSSISEGIRNTLHTLRELTVGCFKSARARAQEQVQGHSESSSEPTERKADVKPKRIVLKVPRAVQVRRTASTHAHLITLYCDSNSSPLCARSTARKRRLSSRLNYCSVSGARRVLFHQS